MKTVTLHNLPWRVWSPSMLELAGSGYEITSSEPTVNRLVIAFNSQYWQVGINDVYGTAEYATRDQAVAAVAKAFADAAAMGA